MGIITESVKAVLDRAERTVQISEPEGPGGRFVVSVNSNPILDALVAIVRQQTGSLACHDDYLHIVDVVIQLCRLGYPDHVQSLQAFLHEKERFHEQVCRYYAWKLGYIGKAKTQILDLSSIIQGILDKYENSVSIDPNKSEKTGGNLLRFESQDLFVEILDAARPIDTAPSVFLRHFPIIQSAINFNAVSENWTDTDKDTEDIRKARGRFLFAVSSYYEHALQAPQDETADQDIQASDIVDEDAGIDLDLAERIIDGIRTRLVDDREGVIEGARNARNVFADIQQALIELRLNHPNAAYAQEFCARQIEGLDTFIQSVEAAEGEVEKEANQYLALFRRGQRTLASVLTAPETIKAAVATGILTVAQICGANLGEFVQLAIFASIVGIPSKEAINEIVRKRFRGNSGDKEPDDN